VGEDRRSKETDGCPLTARGNELQTTEEKTFFTLSYMRGGVAEVWAGRELNEIKQHKREIKMHSHMSHTMILKTKLKNDLVKKTKSPRHRTG
jgi:phage terminase Nu1 subunit (DNA packaging protein)